MEKNSKQRVAIVNSNEDIIDALSLAIAEEGYAISKGHVSSFKRGVEDVIQFIEREDPEVLVWDIAPPYEENWKYFQVVRDMKSSEGKHFIITTTNKDILEKISGTSEKKEEGFIEIVGKPYDAEQILGAIQAYYNK